MITAYCCLPDIISPCPQSIGHEKGIDQKDSKCCLKKTSHLYTNSFKSNHESCCHGLVKEDVSHYITCPVGNFLENSLQTNEC